VGTATILLEHGADATVKGNYGRTLIFIARELNNLALIDLPREARRKQKKQLRTNGASESGISIHANSSTIMRSPTRTDDFALEMVMMVMRVIIFL
jgi:hypothetical protein